MTGVCQCCGQRIAASDQGAAASSRATHWVDAEVLACCNAAHDDAARRGADEVGISHFLLAVARDRAQSSLLASFGLDIRILASVIETELAPVTTQAVSRKLRTSADLRQLLDITQQTAALYGCTCLSIHHLILTLTNPPATLTAARRVGRWFWAARAYPDGAPSSRRDQIQHASAASAQSQSHDASYEQLLARVRRQDDMLADMSRLLARMELKAAEAAPEPVAPPPPPPEPPSAIPVAAAKTADTLADDLADELPIEPLESDNDAALEQAGVKRYFLALEDEIVRAPSIGPRTAARLIPHGITHVKHLLACDPERLSARLGARHLTASRIAAWKNQARLVCTIPWLRGTHAQLLVGAGYASIDKIMSTDRPVVCAAIMQFATTRDGQAILRSGPPPEIDRIMRWIENTQFADPQRAHGSRVTVLN